MWAPARVAVAHGLYPGSFVQCPGLFLPSLARLLDRGYSAYGIHRMVTRTSARSSSCAGVDLSQLDCSTYICAMAHILWAMRSVNYGT
jgi:hypothetical protein